ncbi:hypothetical protein DFH28DRAFT_314435 [Melampsora americana]|nr:hypothetical protein DFH28DRAFT_314435 [Melampsora americana]
MNNQKSNSDQVPNSFTTLNLIQQSQSNHHSTIRPHPIPRSQSNLNLDQTSKSHLYSIILQSIENSGLISNLNHHHHQKRKTNHQFNSTSHQQFFWANELFRIIETDLLNCFTDQILTELQLTKLNLSKSLQELHQSHISSNLRKLKSNPNSPHPLSHTRSGLFSTRVKDHKDAYPALQTPDLTRSKSPDALLTTQTKQDRPNLSPSLFGTALQTASPPELWLPEHSLSTNTAKPDLISRTTLIESLKARTSELIIDSHPDHSISDSCISPKLDTSIGDSDFLEITVRAVKFHLKRIKTKPLDNQREASFEPNQWCTIPNPVQDHSTQTSHLPEASTSKAIRTRIMGQTDIVELFSDSSCKMSDLLGGDSSDSLEPLMVTLRDGRIARVRTELIGGTITLKGPGRELRKLKKVIELAIFAACNMKLEVHVRRDAFCSRPVFLSSQQSEEPRSMISDTEERISTPPPHLDDLIPSSIPQDTPHVAFAQDTPPQSKVTFNNSHSPTSLFGTPNKPPLLHSISSQYSIITADSNWLSPPPPAVASSTSLPLSSSETLSVDASPSTLGSPGLSLDYATPPQSPQSYREPLHSTSPTSQRAPLNNSSVSVTGRAKWSKAGLWGMLLGKPAQSHAHPQLFIPSAPLPLDQAHFDHHGVISGPSENDGIISGDEADTDDDPKSVTPDQTASATPKKAITSSQTPSSSRSPKSPSVTQSSPTARKRFAQRIKKRLESSLETSPTKHHRASKQIMPGSFFYNTYGLGSGFGRRGYAESDEWELVAGFASTPSGHTRRDSAEDGDTTDAGGHGGEENRSIDSIDNPLETSTENRVPSPDVTSDSSDKPKSRTFANRLSNTFLHFKAARLASQKSHRPPSKIAEITDEASQSTSIETQLPDPQNLTETEDEVQGDESVINQPIVGRFERVIEKMNRAILSVSPDVVFPPPHLLVRLRQQEIAEISLFASTTDVLPQLSDLANPNEARSSPQITSASDERSPNTITSPKLSDFNSNRPSPLDRQRSFATADAEVLSNRFADNNSLPNSAEWTPIRTQKSPQLIPQSPRSALSASNVPTSQPSQNVEVVEPRETAPDALHPNLLLSQSPRPRKPLEQRKIAVDARAGLASLMTNNSSLDGTLRHQSIQFLCEKSSLFSSPGTSACESPTWKTWKYYQDFCLNPRALDLPERKGRRDGKNTAPPMKDTGFNVGSLMSLGAAAELLGNQTSNEPLLDTRGLQYKLTGTVGQVVSKLVDERDQLCVQESGIAGKCGGKRMGDHVISLIHNTVRIIVSVEDQLAAAKGTSSSSHEDDLTIDYKGLKRSTSDGGMVDMQSSLANSKEVLSDHEIVMWTKCRICGRCTKVSEFL